MNRAKTALSGLIAASALALPALMLPVGLAQAFPDRPITLIVPSPPGGGTDTFARLLAEIAEKSLGQKVVVENKPGGGGSVGTTLITAAKPDGYTLGFVWNSPLTTSPHSLPVVYTPDSYQTVLSIGYSSYVLCAQPDFPAATAKEMIEKIKAEPGKYTYGNDGVGGTMQLAAERIFKKLDLKVRSVPFGGAGETAKNFLGGHVDFYGGSIPPILAHEKAGKAKCLILTSAEANPALPKASGLDALGIGAEATVLWWAMIAPKGIPAEQLSVLTKTFTQAAEDPRFRELMDKQGAIYALKDAAATEAAIRAELAALGEVAKSIGIIKSN